MRARALACVLAVAGCAAPPPPPPPPTLALTVHAGADQNPDAAGGAAPVAVRLYFLASDGGFQRADFFALTEGPGALGADALGGQELIVRPGETRVIRTDVKPGAQTLGVAVLYRDIDHASWRSEAPLAPHGPTALTLTVGRLTATLAPS